MPCSSASCSTCHLTIRPLRFGAWGVDDESWLKCFKTLYSKMFLPRLSRQLLREKRGEKINNNNFSQEEGRAAEGHRQEEKETRGCIPFVIHHIWLGSEIPHRFRALRDQWISLHPDCQFVLWDDAKVEEELKTRPLINTALYESAANWGEKSDILRLEILLRYGGVYVDVDFACVQSLSPLLRCGAGMLCGLSNVGYVEINNGLIASSPNHPLIRKCVTCISGQSCGIPTGHAAASSSSMELERAVGGPSSRLIEALGCGGLGGDLGTIARTGPGFFTRCVSFAVASWLHEMAGEGGVEEVGGCHALEGGERAEVDLEDACVVLPTRFFYPLANTERVDAGDGSAVGELVRRLRGGACGEGDRGVDGSMDTGGAGGGGGRCCGRIHADGGVFAVHLWARSWCNTSSSAPSSSAASAASSVCTTAVGVLKASDVETSPTRRIGEDEQAARASSTPAAPATPATPATASRGTTGVDLSNSDMVWLANLATRNLKVGRQPGR